MMMVDDDDGDACWIVYTEHRALENWSQVGPVLCRTVCTKHLALENWSQVGFVLCWIVYTDTFP